MDLIVLKQKEKTIPMASKPSIPKTKAKSVPKVKKSVANKNWQDKKFKWPLLLFILVFAVIGIYTLMKSLAATGNVNYWGALTAEQPTARYKLATGSGTMNVSFTNNTADIILTIKKSNGTTVGSLAGKGSTAVTLNIPVTPDTYTFRLASSKPFTGSKGYSVKVSYPIPGTSNTTSPTARRFPGDPLPKVYSKSYWGSSIGGNGDPSRHESPSGKSLAIRRTFWQWDHATNLNSSMYATVQNDLANNRLPMISIKTPAWDSVGRGDYDTQLDAMARKLDSFGKPVWLVLHHEPEGGGGTNSPDDPGGSAAWRLMQTRMRQRLDAVDSKNIAFMPVLMSYTWQSSSDRNPEDWWVPGIWDAYFVDHYHDNVSGSPLKTSWYDFVAWVENKGLPFGVAEWGNRGTDSTAGQEMRNFWNWSFNNKKDMIAYAYFDSGLNSPDGSWELTGEPLKAFRDILKNDTKVQRINSL
jgi:hypothetical protein